MSPPLPFAAPRRARLALATSLFLAALGAAGSVQAAEGSARPTRPAAVDIPHVEGEAKIDGVMDEAFWQTATKVDLPIETRPSENTPADVKTTAYIAEDGKNVLIAFVAEDPDPKQIRAFLRDRDSAYDDDFVGVVLDTFDDERRAYEFFVNPLGAQMDLIIDDTTGNEDDSWDGIWDSAGRITETGFVVEMEIPLSTMRFQGGKDIQTWGADFLRFRPRALRYRLASQKNERGVNCYLCQASRIRGFHDVKPGSNLEITPTLTVRYAQSRDLPPSDFGSEGVKFDAGADIKWGPTPNMTVNATINPDFSQVEADTGQLDVNNTFALFYPEKRPFFLEGADYFSSPNTLVYTRNVNDPDVGLRVTGRSGAGTYGVFVARDTVTDLLIPGVYGSGLQRYDFASNDGALRYRYDLNKEAFVGVLATVRRGDDYENQVQAVDGKWQHGAHTVIGQYIHTSTTDPAAYGGGDSDGDSWYGEYDYSTRNWFAFAFKQRFDDGFRADLGFIGQVGYDQDFWGVTRHWWGDKDDVFNHITLNFRWNDMHRTDDVLLDITRESWVGANGPLQSYYEIGHVERDKLWNGVRFDEELWRIRAQLTPWRGVELALFARTGDRVDLANTKLGKVLTVNPSATFNIGRSTTLTVNHNYERLSRDGGDVYVANLTDLRLSYQFNLRQRLRMAVLRNDLKLDPSLYDPSLYPTGVPPHQRTIDTQLIYSYKINPRTALYAGYADNYFGGDVETGISLPGSPDYDFYPVFQSNRAVFLKIGYAWEK
jgi:hypothetical protein